MTLSSPIQLKKFLVIKKISKPCEWISTMRQLIAVTSGNPNRNAVETGSYTLWNNQAYDSGTHPRHRFQSRGYHGQQHQYHMVDSMEGSSSTVNLCNRIDIIFASPKIMKMSRGKDDN
ncbi:hypothetical protein TNIN_441351 [Trichonephila inaurata madagascariensis]|uniref:Uncharacterized protein n=1 Tax=Trichonephila inaurata madagascariensis TaxID=2747483 RepID=A0A8X6XL10_9ARAC|nr:hypothetical protein TNIN_441351 [Trichonephila inaurata madagascariensis]